MCFVPGRGPAALVVIHKHSPASSVEGGREKNERRRGKKKKKQRA